jgi:hypothetical protein
MMLKYEADAAHLEYYFEISYGIIANLVQLSVS